MLNPGAILQGRYQIIREIGNGGFGAVYLAYDQRFGNRQVVVKENQGGDPIQFQTEANILGALNHPNLPRVFDHFSDPTGAQFLVMDYVEGQNLEAIVQQRGALRESEALGWLRQIIDAVEYLHQNRIIHRDIKPQNIIVTPQNRAMLVDFGIAKRMVTGRPTQTGARAATPGFSAPEQYAGGTSERSDIYSLCATLYALLTTQVPPEAPTLASGSAQLIPPTSLNRQVTLLTEQAILRGMSIQASLRYQSVGELRSALAGTHAIAPTVPANQTIPYPYTPPQTVPYTPPSTVPSSSFSVSPIIAIVLGSLLLLCIAGSVVALLLNAKATPTPTRIASGATTVAVLTRDTSGSIVIPTVTPGIVYPPTDTRTPTVDTQQTVIFLNGLTATAISAQQTAVADANKAQQTVISAQQTGTAIAAWQTSVSAQQTMIAINATQTAISARQTADAYYAQQTRVSMYATQTALARPPTQPALSYSSLAAKRYPSLCLGVQGNSLSDGAFIEQRTCNGSTNQSWGLQSMGGGFYQFVVRSSGKCMTVQDGSTQEWALIIQQTCRGADYQLWSLRQYGGYYQLVAKHSGQCVDEDAFRSNQGLEMQQGPCGTSDIDNQLWQLK